MPGGCLDFWTINSTTEDSETFEIKGLWYYDDIVEEKTQNYSVAWHILQNMRITNMMCVWMIYWDWDILIMLHINTNIDTYSL